MSELPKLPDDRPSSWAVDEDGNWKEVPFLVVDLPCSPDFDLDPEKFKDNGAGGTWSA